MDINVTLPIHEYNRLLEIEKELNNENRVNETLIENKFLKQCLWHHIDKHAAKELLDSDYGLSILFDDGLPITKI